MAILPSDVKLYESQRMTDTTDGGGRMTNHEIPDNVAGNLFPKISRPDSVYGRINFRKFFLGINTANIDVYAGACVGLFKPPANPNVNITLFTTGSDFDTRVEAQNRIEGYVIKGVKSRMKLFGDQIIGQKAILVYQKTTEQLPEIGETYLLSVEKTGYTPAEQYIRITELKYEDREFTLSAGGGGEQTFVRRVITLGLTNPLKQTFPGAEVTYMEDTGSPTVVRETNVADTAQYYGIQSLVGSYAPGVMSVKADSMFAPLVPSTSRETAIGLASVNNSQVSVPCAANEIIFTPPTRQSSRYFPISINLKTTQLYIDGFKTQIPINDGSGQFYIGDVPYKIIGQNPFHVEYQGGGTWLNYAYNWYFDNPTAYVSHPSHTTSIPVTLGTQGLVQSLVCTPIPAPGTLMLDYRSNGRWYRLVDDGTGMVADADGNTALGSGKVNFVDGSLLVTLGALPDVGSSLLLSWGSHVHYELLSVSTPTINPPTVRQTLDADDAGNVLVPGSITASWGTGLSVTDDGHGKFTGAAGSGTINYATRQVFLQFASLPAPNTVVQWTYNQLAPNATSPQTVTAASTIGNLQLNGIGGGSLKAGAVRIVASVNFPGSITAPVTFLDDGNGKLIAQPIDFGGANIFYKLDRGYGPNTAGTIDYVTGNAVIYHAAGYVTFWDQTAGHWQTQSYTGTWLGNTATCYFSLTTDALSAKTDSTTIDKLQIDLTPYTANALVPNALLFDTCGRTYYDKQGSLYDQFDYATGSGHIAGSVDYATGIATLTEWVTGASPAFTLRAGLTKFGDFWVYYANWRVPGSPLRPASLYVQISTADGRLIAGSSDQNGKITGPEMDGHVQQEMGVVNVRFGMMVLDSSLTPAEKSEPWYSAANVDGTGHIWRPTKCMPETLRYSCVVLSQLPLDPALLGLDPVRLPRDGRVPIFRPANIVVLHNTREDDAPTLSAGQSIQISRAPFDVFMILDATGKKLDPAIYTIDLDTGVLTMATPLDLTGYTAPFRLLNRTDDMNLVSVTNIDGTIQLQAPTKYAHDSSSYITSLIYLGDLQARYTNLFDQQTWTGTWSDTLIGNAANATYDDLNYPIEVLNNGAVNERWRIEFTSSTAFNVVGEHLGVIATGNTSTDIAVVNNLTGKPYFVLRKGGWGIGWAAGNQLRFNTLGATGSIWAARTILSGAAVTGDAFVIERRGDVD